MSLRACQPIQQGNAVPELIDEIAAEFETRSRLDQVDPKQTSRLHLQIQALEILPRRGIGSVARPFRPVQLPQDVLGYR